MEKTKQRLDCDGEVRVDILKFKVGNVILWASVWFYSATIVAYILFWWIGSWGHHFCDDEMGLVGDGFYWCGCWVGIRIWQKTSMLLNVILSYLSCLIFASYLLFTSDPMKMVDASADLLIPIWFIPHPRYHKTSRYIIFLDCDVFIMIGCTEIGSKTIEILYTQARLRTCKKRFRHRIVQQSGLM